MNIAHWGMFVRSKIRKCQRWEKCLMQEPAIQRERTYPFGLFAASSPFLASNEVDLSKGMSTRIFQQKNSQNPFGRYGFLFLRPWT